MDNPVYDRDFCPLCSTPSSYCNCGLSNSPWSKSVSQTSSCTFRVRNGLANFDVDEHNFCTIDGENVLSSPFQNSNFEIDAMIQWSESGSQHSCVASTPKNNYGVEQWESPVAMPPPESSSPVCFDIYSSPFATGLAVSTDRPCREGPAVERHLLCCPLDASGSWPVKAFSPFNHRSDSNASTIPTMMSMSHSSPLPAYLFESSPSVTARNVVLESFNNRPIPTTDPRFVPGEHDIYLLAARTAIDETNDLAKSDEVDRQYTPRPASLRKAPFSGRTILDLTVPTELDPASLYSTDNDKPNDATTTSSETGRDDDAPSTISPRALALVSAFFPVQAPMNNLLKRRRSSFDCFPESKKAKLDRTVSYVFCPSNSSVQSKYQATRPASFRRADSLTSDTSACSKKSTNSTFYPSPLSSLISGVFPDPGYVPTAPSTPLPNSVDYARSKANPLARTLAIYRHRSLEVPKIPPVPIIAPPRPLPPIVVRGPEDHAVDRIKALLFRERSERERDGLGGYDDSRTARLKAIYRTNPSFPRRESTSTSESSDDHGQWEDESTFSATESLESQELAPRVKVQVVTEQYRLAFREVWCDLYNISDDFRREVTRWLLEEIPKKPVQYEGDRRPPGTDLYDQLTNVPQTRFHAAQLFHRYFLLPEKVAHCRNAYNHERVEWECQGSHDDARSGYEMSIWNLAVACMALSVKLHRDCLDPLKPIFAAEFMAMAPYTMTHETFELTQRDVLYKFQFRLGSCTPQDVLEELWNALPTLRKATAPIGWSVAQSVTWDKLFESLLEPDMLQWPITLLTAAALVDAVTFALASQYMRDNDANICKCNATVKILAPDRDLDDTWRIVLYEADKLADDVIEDIKDVLHLSPMEFDECRKWLSHVGQA